ncbi:MAG: hypothetical protein DRN90_08640 [Thermoproteota archaeon]|nr:MAG: hypothetical protein DRN90_08640 [Candidatus Korarchaeota archaeon]
MRISFLGGISEIGGNKVLLEHNGFRILLDFGKSFKNESKFFMRPYLAPFSISDLIKLDLIPNFPGTYKWQEGEPSIDGVLVSHAHLDHYGYVPLLKPEIPIYMGETSKIIIKARQDARTSSWERKVHIESIKTFRTGSRLEIGPFQVDPIHVDHSIPGSYAFLIEAGGKRVVYTGDFRFHGQVSQLSRDFVEKAQDFEPDLMIIEGTRVAPESDPEEAMIRLLEQHNIYQSLTRPPLRVKKEAENEEGVLDEMKAVAEIAENSLILIEANTTDIDRLRTVWLLSKHLGRQLIIGETQALILKRLLEEDPRIKNLPRIGDFLLYLSRRRRENSWEEVKEGRRRPAIRNLISMIEDQCGPEAVIWGENRRRVAKEPNSFVILTPNSPSTLMGILPESGERFPITFILSRSEPFNEELAMSFDRLLNWLAYLGVRKYYRIHVSGHVRPEELGTVISEINPEKVIPIHTSYPELFEEYLPPALRKNISLVSLNETLEL